MRSYTLKLDSLEGVALVTLHVGRRLEHFLMQQTITDPFPPKPFRGSDGAGCLIDRTCFHPPLVPSRQAALRNHCSVRGRCVGAAPPPDVQSKRDMHAGYRHDGVSQRQKKLRDHLTNSLLAPRGVVSPQSRKVLRLTRVASRAKRKNPVKCP